MSGQAGERQALAVGRFGRILDDAAANQPKTFVAYPGACHEPLFHADPVDYAARLQAFLRIEAMEAKESEEAEE